MTKIDRTNQLRTALQQLEALTQAIATDPIKEIYQSQVLDNAPVSQEPSLVQKILGFASSLFPRKKLSKEEMGQIFHQIASVLPWLEEMEKGSPDQQKLAARAIQVIEKYNHLIDEISKRVPSSYVVPSKIFINKKIEFPKPPSPPPPPPRAVKAQTENTSRVDGTVRSFFAESLFLSTSDRFSLREEDLFRMKAISLLKDSMGLKWAIQAVKQAPIEKKWDASQNMFVAVQTVTTLPGEKRVITGAFDSKKSLIHFNCTFITQQTGFPASCQYTGGIILSSLLISPELREKQLTLAKSLLPDGEKNAKAKKLITIKREAFDLQREELLLMHKKWTENFISQALERPLKESEEHIITCFFEILSRLKQAFEVMSQTFQFISTYVIDEQLTEEEIASLNTTSAPEIADFILLNAKVLAPSIARLRTGSPQTDFDHHLLRLADKQQLAFYEEIYLEELPSVDAMAQRMKTLLAETAQTTF